jgi:hypothetical protein
VDLVDLGSHARDMALAGVVAEDAAEEPERDAEHSAADAHDKTEDEWTRAGHNGYFLA